MASYDHYAALSMAKTLCHEVVIFLASENVSCDGQTPFCQENYGLYIELLTFPPENKLKKFELWESA